MKSEGEFSLYIWKFNDTMGVWMYHKEIIRAFLDKNLPYKCKYKQFRAQDIDIKELSKIYTDDIYEYFETLKKIHNPETNDLIEILLKYIDYGY